MQDSIYYGHFPLLNVVITSVLDVGNQGSYRVGFTSIVLFEWSANLRMKPSTTLLAIVSITVHCVGIELALCTIGTSVGNEYYAVELFSLPRLPVSKICLELLAILYVAGMSLSSTWRRNPQCSSAFSYCPQHWLRISSLSLWQRSRSLGARKLMSWSAKCWTKAIMSPT